MRNAKVIKFKNGATLIYRKDRNNNYSAVQAGFVAGHVANSQNGISHFLEHMLFKQTKNKNLEQIAETQELLIPRLNAYTSSNAIMVNFSRTNKLFDEAMEFAGEILTQTKLNKKHIEDEKGVIKEEYRIRCDKYRRDINANHLKLLTTNCPTEAESLGTPEDIDAINIKALDNFRQNNYYANNFIGCYVGNLPLLKVIGGFKKYFLVNLKENKNYKPKTVQFTINKEPSMQVCTNEDKAIKIKISFKYHLPYVESKLKYEQKFLTNYFNRNKNLLYNSLRNKGLVYSTYIGIGRYEDDMTLNISITTSKDKLNRVLREVNNSIKYVTNDKLTDDELKVLKENVIYNRDETVPAPKNDKASYLVDEFLTEGKGNVKNPSKWKCNKAIKKVTVASMNKFIHELFNSKNLPYITFMGDIKANEVPSYEQICKTIYNNIK